MVEKKGGTNSISAEMWCLTEAARTKWSSFCNLHEEQSDHTCRIYVLVRVHLRFRFQVPYEILCTTLATNENDPFISLTKTRKSAEKNANFVHSKSFSEIKNQPNLFKYRFDYLLVIQSTLKHCKGFYLISVPSPTFLKPVVLMIMMLWIQGRRKVLKSRGYIVMWLT